LRRRENPVRFLPIRARWKQPHHFEEMVRLQG
jgi:hypothetical protein